jgi:predicted O-linked N-acetylglucosamine transferase (SPINDLY family)
MHAVRAASATEESMQRPDNTVGELMALFSMRRFGEMEMRARALLASGRGSAILDEMLGIALVAQQRHAEALSPLRKAVRRAPNDAQFWDNLGLCQRALRQFADAEKSLRQALRLRPDSIESRNALGSVLRSLGRLEDAEKAFREVIAQAPHHAAATVNLANTLHDLGRLADAEAGYRRAIEIDPRSAWPHANLAIVLNELGRHGEAVALAERALELVGGLSQPAPAGKLELLDNVAAAFAGARASTAAAQVHAFGFRIMPTTSRAVGAFSAARWTCDWDLAAEVEPAARAAGQAADTAAGTPVPFPFALLMMASASPADQLGAARAYARQFCAPAILRHPRRGESKHRLRIGYFSGDLRDHPVTHLIAGVIERHDRDRFEVVAYDFTPAAEDPYRQRIVAAFDRVVPIRASSNDGAARAIAEDRVDVLIDLVGWTLGHRAPVLARRPAPLQLYWLGSPGTTGAPWIDYYIADRITAPAGDEAHFAEKLIRLPHCYLPADDARAIGNPGTRSDHGLPDDAFVFCSFNQPYKISREIFGAWMGLLREVPGAVLWLARLSADAETALRTAAERAGISTDRLVFAGRVPDLADHLARIAHADLALDCFPYGSHTTATDMLWAGVPMVALRGETFASRVSASVLAAAGLGELVTTTLDDYAALALRLAGDRPALQRLRTQVGDRRRDCALFDTAGFTRDLERAFTAVWSRHAAGLPPDHVDIG